MSAIKLYQSYAILLECRFWFPVFMLYFTSSISLENALLLEAVYYASVALLEVPLGVLSDRVGREKILFWGTVSEILCYVFFIFGESFQVWSVAQFLFASAMACNSGTDKSLHYELCQSSRIDFKEQETKVTTQAFYAGAGATILGGISGMVALWIPFGLSLLAALLRLVITSRMTAIPSVPDTRETVRDGFHIMSSLTVRGLLLYEVLGIMLVHIPYEFSPKIIEWSGYSTSQSSGLSGLHFFLAMLISIPFLKIGKLLLKCTSARVILLLSLSLQCGLVIVLCIAQNLLVVLLLIGRKIPRALGHIAFYNALLPHIPQKYRASTLSCISLMGRLLFSMALMLLALEAPDRELPVVGLMLIGGISFVVGVYAFSLTPSELE